MWSGANVEIFIKDGSPIYQHSNMNVLVEAIDTFDKAEWQQLFPKIVSLSKEIGDSNFIKSLVGKEMVELKRGQVAAVLAKSFLCTFPPDQKINFVSLFDSRSCQPGNLKRVRIEKVKALFAYFQVYFKYVEGGNIKDEKIIYELVRGEQPKWDASEHKILPITIFKNVSLYFFDCAQVNFANKHVGGGVLGNGCVQEEVRFITCPELLLARFIFPNALRDDEAVIIYNFLCYANHSGYGHSFSCDGENELFLEEKQRVMLCMDALDYSSSPTGHQYEKGAVDRELLKAFTAFKASPTQEIATGNWGGGVFSGDPELKAIVQMIASAQAGRCLVYCTVGEKKDQDKLEKKIKKINSEYTGMTVSAGYKELLKLCTKKSSAQ